MPDEVKQILQTKIDISNVAIKNFSSFVELLEIIYGEVRVVITKMIAHVTIITKYNFTKVGLRFAQQVCNIR